MTDHPNITRTSDAAVGRYHIKSWGHEAWIANSDLYCGKKLIIKPKHGTSMHFHVRKTEHIYVQEGQLGLVLIENKKKTRYTLNPGDWVLITPGLVHSLYNGGKNKIPIVLFEFSTQHFDNDSYRIA